MTGSARSNARSSGGRRRRDDGAHGVVTGVLEAVVRSCIIK